MNLLIFDNMYISIYHLMMIVEARIEETYSSIGAIQTQIRSQFKVAMLQQSRSVRSMKVEDFYYNNIDNANNLDLTVECAKVAVSVSNDVNNEVKTTVKGMWNFIFDTLNKYATLHKYPYIFIKGDFIDKRSYNRDFRVHPKVWISLEGTSL